MKKNNLTNKFNWQFLIAIFLVTILFCDVTYAEGAIWFPKNEFSTKFNQIFSNPNTQVSEDGKIQFQKSIESIDTDEFKITLDITTEDIIEPVKNIPASVVLVVDVSGSMKNPISSTDNTPIYIYLKEAVSKFAEEFLKYNNTDNLLGLVSYDTFIANELQDPFDPRPEDSLTNDLTKYLNTVSKITVGDRQTNIQGALKMAREILEQDNSGNPKYIVLFSDGAANHSYKANSASEINTSIIPHKIPGGELIDMSFRLSDFNYDYLTTPWYKVGQYFVYNHYIPTVSEGIITKEKDINIYTVFFHNPNLDTKDYHQGVFTMNNIASLGQYHEIDDITGLADLFYELEQDIIHKIKLWYVNDPMGDFITFNGLTQPITSGAAFYEPETNTLKWNLLHSSIFPERVEQNKYKYSLSYYIKLESTSEGFDNKEVYPTNGKTTLDYFIGNDWNTGTKKQVEFNVPQVKGISKNNRTINVVPLNMVAYQGGESASGNSFPRPYFALKYDDGRELTQDEIANLSFYMDGVKYEPYCHEYFIYEYPFRAYYINRDTGKIHNDPQEIIHPEDVGFYNIQLTASAIDGHTHYITAIDKEGNVFDFQLNQDAILEIREQNFEHPTQFTKYIEGTPENNFYATQPTAFVPIGTEFKNSAGVSLKQLFSNPDVRLMADKILPYLDSDLDKFLSQLDIVGKMNYEKIYLDLVDYADGNIIVEADNPVTVFYPYPSGTDKNTEFNILHFYEINRKVGVPISYSFDNIKPTKLEKGLIFQTKSFSPFIVAFKNNITYTVSFNLNGGTAIEPLAQYDDQIVFANSKVKKPSNPIRKGYNFVRWETSINDNKIKAWDFENDIVQNDIILTAKWEKVINNVYNPVIPPVPPSSSNFNKNNVVIKDNIQQTSPPELNKYDHFAYMVGYPEGIFKPDSKVTRAEAATMFARLMTEQISMSKNYTSTFKDVESDKWYYNEIGYLQQKGIIKDKTDYYRPNEAITRAEFAVMAAAFENFEDDIKKSVFIDVPEDYWAAKEISFAVEKSWIKGYPDGRFRPEQFITRAEVVTLTNQVLERIADENFIIKYNELLKKFKDLSNRHWAYNNIIEATNGHDYTRQLDKSEIWTELWDKK